MAILCERPADLMLWTLATAVTTASIPTGETGAPIIAALLWMAVAMRRGAWALAALAAAFAMLVPHVGLPAVLAAFLFVPQMRRWIAACGLMLGVLDVFCGGMQTALSYFTQVLPAHARAEIGSSMQFGMTWMLHALNATDRLALAGGELCYAIMTIAGLWAARKYMRQRGDSAYAALIPPAFAVLGGTFIHLAQIAVAIPAALLLFLQAAPRIRPVFAAAFLLLACPWLAILGKPLLVFVYAVVCGGLAVTVLAWRPAVALRVALGAVVICGVIMLAASHFGAAYAAHVSVTPQPVLAQSSWGQFVGSHWSSTGIAWWIAKAPTWIGLLLLPLGCAYVLAKEDLIAPVAVENVPVAP